MVSGGEEKEAMEEVKVKKVRVQSTKEEKFRAKSSLAIKLHYLKNPTKIDKKSSLNDSWIFSNNLISTFILGSLEANTKICHVFKGMLDKGKKNSLGWKHVVVQ